MNKSQESDSLTNWQKILVLNCRTQKALNIISNGDWQFHLYFRQTCTINHSIQYLMKQNKNKGHFYSENHQNVPISAKQYPKDQNVEDAWQRIPMKVNLSEKQFKQKFGFWKIKNFTIYDETGNDSKCSFQTEGNSYVGFYYTS